MKITIGIPCFKGVSAEVLEDYMRFMYHLGRRYQEHDFYLAIRSKQEQFRARNAIVEAALQVGSDYLLMLDDDMVIDYEHHAGPNGRYDFLRKLIAHDKPIVGALYYQRGGHARPVVMKQGSDGGYYFLRDEEITGELQEVAVQGGGCILIKTEVFNKVPSPWFQPENDYGTDIQICKAAKEAGFTVWCDTSIDLGHIRVEPEVITKANRVASFAGLAETEGLNRQWVKDSPINLYIMDGMDYLGLSWEQVLKLADTYFEDMHAITLFEDKSEYYQNRGKEQLARQMWFHDMEGKRKEAAELIRMLSASPQAYGLDFGCGSAPVGFELAIRGHKVDLVDLDGAGAYEFAKWRAQRYPNAQIGWKLQGPYDYVLALDSIEHIEDWQGVLGNIVKAMKPGAPLITNYFVLDDHENVEHVSMDQAAVRAWMVDHGFYAVNEWVWIYQPAKAAA